jgi:hypothetical protein
VPCAREFSTSALFALVIAFLLAPVGAAGLEVPIAAKSLAVRSGAAVKFWAKSSQQPGIPPFPLPAAGSSDDPTLHGATLTVADVGLIGGRVQYVLGASGWRALGDPPGSAGYRYGGHDDASQPDGPCRSVVVRSDTLRAVCRGEVPLATPFADAASIELALGTSTPRFRYCAELGGEETRNDASVLKRKNALPPLACPVTECPTVDFISSASVGAGCWYLAPGISCDEMCEIAGLRYSEATRTFAGSDGTLGHCNAVLDALGFPSAVDFGCAGAGEQQGFGCFYATELGPPSIRCTAPATTADAEHFDAGRACACR